jgi:hypothetical protein
MNREQWLKKRSQIETHGIAPAFGAPNFAGQTHLMEVSSGSGPDFATIREHHFGDELATDEWTMIARSHTDFPGGSH